jgi:hypothetical protein
MSLYAFGKVVSSYAAEVAAALGSVAISTGARIQSELIDPDDEIALEAFPSLRGAGVAFAIVSGAAESDATRLWIDAMTKMRSGSEDAAPSDTLAQFRRTQLGEICFKVLGLGDAAGLALVDGGIEDVFEATLERCMERIARDVISPWDQSPNRLYVRLG